jgi:hypothetical protein
MPLHAPGDSPLLLARVLPALVSYLQQAWPMLRNLRQLQALPALSPLMHACMHARMC